MMSAFEMTSIILTLGQTYGIQPDSIVKIANKGGGQKCCVCFHCAADLVGGQWNACPTAQQCRLLPNGLPPCQRWQASR